MGSQLSGKTVIVTGAGSVAGPPDRPPIGNGRAAAIVYAREGASVMAVDLNIAAAEETMLAITKEGGICSVFQADVTQFEDCRDMAEQCAKTYGRIDILHNNVGILGKLGGLLEMDEKDWDRVMNVNAKSMFQTCRAVVPHMVARGTGAILNISSLGAVQHHFTPIWLYTVSKAAVNSLTRCLAVQLASKGIRVNAIMPGMIDTPMIYHDLPGMFAGDVAAMRENRNKSVPAGKMGEPWDIANAALFLVSDQAKYITGQIIAVDGGQMWTTSSA
ncbi:MAG: SDR family NAD(P)-dependent oxidoreductase [Syntrophorhabdales bacterium]|jgi:NAD(P)-dependent dehydrogenase (short-subunit alcohol dehydrogenase family)